MKQKTPKQYPMDGPPVWIQRLRSLPSRTKQQTLAMRMWLKEFKKRPGARKETIETYTV